MLCYKSPLVSQPQPFLGHTGISNQRVLNAVGLIQRSIPVNVWFQLLLRTSSWKHKANHTLDCFIGSRARHKDLETGHVCAVVTNICTWRWDWLPSLGSLGQVRYQSWEEKGWFIMWKKVRSLPACSNQPNLVLIYENTPKHPLGEKGMLCFPDHRFPWWQVSHSKLYPQLCLWDFTEGFVWVREGREYSHMQKHRTH